MKTRLAAATLLVIVAAACGEVGPAQGDGVVLRYAYQPGSSLAYEVDLSMNMTMEASGDSAAAAAMDATMAMQVTERMSLAFAEGPDPDTIQITMTQEVVDGGARMTSMGQEQLIPFDELAEGMENEVVVVVDPQGTLVSASVGGVPLPTQLLTVLSALGGTNMIQPQQLGPEFPKGGLSVGEEWETEGSASVLGLDITQRGTHRVVGEEQVLGRTTYRIDSRITTGRIAADLADMIEAMRENPELLGGADPAQMDAAIGQFEAMGVEVSFEMQESTVEMTTWFDPVAGIVVQTLLETPVTMTMAMRGIPGGDIDVTMEMTSSQRMALAE